MSKAGRTGVELAEVEAAVAELAAEDRRPTLRSVRERLGRGSLGTIQKYLAELEKRAESAVPSEPLPSAIAYAIFAFVHEHAGGVEAKLAQQRAAADETIRSLVDANDQLTQSLDTERERCTLIQQQSDVRAGRIAELEEGLRVAREEVQRQASAREVADMRVAKLEVQLERLPQAEATLDSLQSRILDQETAIGEARMGRATATAELAASKEVSEHYRSRVDALQADLSRTVAAMDETTRQLKSAEAENSKLTAMLEKRLGEGVPQVPPAKPMKSSRVSAR
jgi:hypothetical protein